ncbi:aldo/keto reductase [Sporolactobacillus shoreicorticis]|uniref:Aldo/keto reductase n=1 Tax=Sporolactobacillus shoreicorticis TaxID=1923877 RepID=A0ABW5S7B1_9BACL|nr:aldo/keto reductase [Sporolactobacillus shoreicorticis]MCO7125526.1 aldo/keto reductase [Sporolactobacillus shoreicorticis]
MVEQTITAASAGTFKIGGDLPVNRLGYGTMQLTGPGVWGDPKNPDEAVHVLQTAVDLGVNFIDTADAYGPYIANDFVKKALHPYPSDLVIATKVGNTRQGPDRWIPVGRPEYLRQQVEMNLRTLGQDSIDLLQLHRIDPKVPLADQIGELALMKLEGKIRHIGLSQVSVGELQAANEITPIVSVQNLYNLAKRDSEMVLNYCEKEKIAFIPWFPLATGQLAKEGGPLDKIAKKYNAKPAQIALAWLLKRSPVVLPIPGTSSVAHVKENITAAGITLSDEDFKILSQAV